MGTKVESCQQMGTKNTIGRYLFFGEELFVGDTSFGEGHVDILASSGRQREEIKVAGGYSVVLEDQIMIHGGGSSDLKIRSADPTPVVQFVEGFPDAKEKMILASRLDF